MLELTRVQFSEGEERENGGERSKNVGKWGEEEACPFCTPAMMSCSACVVYFFKDPIFYKAIFIGTWD